jgi:RNA polymerase sigma-70 factor (ECF subfamily)
MQQCTSNKPDDNEIFFRIQEGDPLAFELVFKAYYIPMVGYANTILHDMDMAENIVQNVFVKLWENRTKYHIKNLKGYLLVAVRNSCNNEFKRIHHENEYQKQLDNNILTGTLNFSDSVVMDKINQVINQLPEQRKRIFKLSRLEGLKYREIAKKLNISPKTVEIQMGKALKFLREHLMELKKQVY